MLRKLIKYDLISMGRTMVPLWVLTIITSIFMGIYLRFQALHSGKINPDRFGFIMFMLALIILFVVIMVLNVVEIIQRFWNGLLKEEGYLMYTIPVSTRKLILSKVISGVLITIGSVITACIVAFMYFSLQWVGPIDFENISINLLPEAVIDTIILLFDGMAAIYFAYAAMAIGQLSTRSRLFCSFGAYIGLHIVQTLILTAGAFVVATFFPFFRGLIKYIPDSMLLIAPLIAIIVEIIILHAITEYLLTNKLNLE
ncbi:MAG: hypothetical protein Q4D45_11325 [Lachnospiraceae bacterium]|nr:hypothetical protein [Lachnospiraceae bacterium]